VSTTDASPTTPPAPARGAQTVAPVQASALRYAAAILGEGGYVPERTVGAALAAAARGQDAPLAQPVSAPPVAAAEVRPEPRRGFFARLWHRLFGG